MLILPATVVLIKEMGLLMDDKKGAFKIDCMRS